MSSDEVIKAMMQGPDALQKWFNDHPSEVTLSHTQE